MGWTPRQTDEVALWEYLAALKGWNRAQSGEEEMEPPTLAEHDALMAKYG